MGVSGRRYAATGRTSRQPELVRNSSSSDLLSHDADAAAEPVRRSTSTLIVAQPNRFVIGVRRQLNRSLDWEFRFYLDLLGLTRINKS